MAHFNHGHFALPQKVRAQPAKHNLLVACSALWLCGGMFTSATVAITGSPELSLFIGSMWIVIPMLLCRAKFAQITFSFLNTKRRDFLPICLLLFLAAAAISTVLSIDVLRSFGYLLATGATLLICITLCRTLDEDFPRLLKLFSILGALALCVVYFKHQIDFNGRLVITVDEGSNHLGRMCYTVAAAGLAWENLWVRFAVLAVTTTILLATQSRGSELALAAALLTYLCTGRKSMIRTSSVILVALIVFVVAVGGLVSLDSVASVFSLNDPNRGIHSGFTGRTTIWGVAFDVFASNPLFGGGFRIVDEYLLDQFITLGSVHNGYLSALAEVGVFGALPFFVMLVLGTGRIWRATLSGNQIARVGLALIAGYYALGFFESVLFNLASPTAVMFWCCLLGYPSILEVHQRGLRKKWVIQTKSSPAKGGPCPASAETRWLA